MSESISSAGGDSALPALLAALETLEGVGRALHPPRLPALAAEAAGVAAPLRDALGKPVEGGDRDPTDGARAAVELAARHALAACDGLAAAAAAGPDGLIEAYRALRAAVRAQEALYPLAATVPQVSRFFVEPALREDARLARLLADASAPRDGVGVMHFGNALDARGGYSAYVPEYHDQRRAWPLIVALHGGSGHGADFLWTWLREARSRGAIIISPTAQGRTWSLNAPAVDGGHLAGLVAMARERWQIDPEHVLLTGMSDGGTFTYVAGLEADSPFTHLAPCSASFSPTLVDRSARARLAGLPVYIVHGALDWMFPADFADIARAALTRAGANVVLREIANLSHTYARDENPRILDWFLG